MVVFFIFFKWKKFSIKVIFMWYFIWKIKTLFDFYYLVKSQMDELQQIAASLPWSFSQELNLQNIYPDAKINLLAWYFLYPQPRPKPFHLLFPCGASMWVPLVVVIFIEGQCGPVCVGLIGKTVCTILYNIQKAKLQTKQKVRW